MPATFGTDTYGSGTYGTFVALEVRLREKPPTRLTIEAETPSGRFYRWAEDAPSPDNVPSGVRLSSTMPGGYETFDCALPRKPGATAPDLQRLTTIRASLPGKQVWEGRLERAPQESGDQFLIAPSAVGWQAHLEDDKTAREIYVDQDFNRWGSASVQRRENIRASAPGYVAGDGTVYHDTTTGQPSLALIQNGGWENTTRPFIVALYDAGAGVDIGSIYYAWKKNADIDNTNTNWRWLIQSSAADVMTSSTSSGSLRAAGPGTGTLTPASGHRFAELALIYDAGPVVSDNGEYVIYWTRLAVYGDHGLTKYGTESATEAKGLLASDGVTHSVQTWAPLLNVIPGSTVQPSGFVISHMIFPDNTTAAEMVRQWSRFGLQDWAVWDDKTFWWTERNAQGRSWRARVGPSGLKDNGPQVDRLWESVVVQYQDVDGSTRTVGPVGSGADTESDLLKDTDPANPANQLGITRRADLQMGVSTPAGATEVGARFLEAQKLLDTAGQATLTGHVEDDKGILHAVSEIRGGDDITFVDASDPSPRRVVRADYDHSTRSCSVELDSPPDGLAALLERLSVDLVPLAVG